MDGNLSSTRLHLFNEPTENQQRGSFSSSHLSSLAPSSSQQNATAPAAVSVSSSASFQPHHNKRQNNSLRSIFGGRSGNSRSSSLASPSENRTNNVVSNFLMSPVQWIRDAHSSILQAGAQHILGSAATVAASAAVASPKSAPASSVSSSGSVHMQLNTKPQTPPKDSQQPPPPKPPQPVKNNVTTIRVHTYIHSRTGKTYKAINTVKRKFLAFLDYHNVTAAHNGNNCACGGGIITTKEYKFDATNPIDQAQQERMRTEWRKLWKQRRLLTDRTEFLAVYPSDENGSNNKKNKQPSRKRGGFADLLHLYRERLVAILEDERKDRTWSTREPPMVTWLREHYGRDATTRLQASNLRLLSEAEQKAELKAFLEWFRSYFPYFYDRCGVCGASIKEEYQNIQQDQQHQEHCNNPDDGEEAEDAGYQTFLGYIYPGEAELKGKASRTELYQCHKCASFTRFPRFNSAWHVMENRQGRCGEYSMLLFRFLRALNHEARWVVDWADHVWAEVYLQDDNSYPQPTANGQRRRGRWIHLDPCEAAVDENLIYQGWGKKQTYILGFYAPASKPHGHQYHHHLNGWQRQPIARDLQLSTPLIQDVTSEYTSDDFSVIQQRRDETQEQVDAAISDATVRLKARLNKFGTTLNEASAPQRWR